MTMTDRLAFGQTFNGLCVAFGKPIETASMAVYFDALEDLPIEAVQGSARELQRTGGEFFPTTAKWHAEAERAVAREVRKALPPGRVVPWQYDCPACEDTGWTEHTCTAVHRCGRPRCDQDPAHTHTYVQTCPCRATNPTYRRHREAEHMAINRNVSR